MKSRMRNIQHVTTAALVFIACVLMPSMCPADFHDWTWMSGSDTIDQAGVYGTMGTPNDANVPGNRNEAISWTDSSSNLWLFGGLAQDSLWGAVLLNDLWRYEPATGVWTWMSGSNTINQVGDYGTMGTPDAANMPGARFSSISWTDNFGNLWLFGGLGYDSNLEGSLNDLWHYELATGMWTWMSGSNTINQVGDYGTMGTPDAANIPRARWGSISWTDSSGNLWLFGGETLHIGEPCVLNDLWRYEPATGMWTWMSGSNTINQVGDYGTMGTPDAANMPRARHGSISWTDSSDNLWLFGGVGSYNIKFFGPLNDLWRYEPATGMWTWMSGSNTINQVSNYYSCRGTSDAANVPGARHGSIAWTDSFDNLWLFGGSVFDPDSSFTHAYQNDLWRYDPATDMWAWMSGMDALRTSGYEGPEIYGVYGCKGTPERGNIPGGHYESISWSDSSGNLWLFGGYGYDSARNNSFLNDLWRYETLDCIINSDCMDDNLYCTGAPMCTDGTCGFAVGPCGGDAPICDEELDLCVECLENSHCGTLSACENSVCISKCKLTITYKAIRSEQLTKPRKITLKITADSFTAVDLGLLQVLKIKVNRKQGTLKATVRVPAGLTPQIIPIRVGDCVGEVEIL